VRRVCAPCGLVAADTRASDGTHTSRNSMVTRATAVREHVATAARNGREMRRVSRGRAVRVRYANHVK